MMTFKQWMKQTMRQYGRHYVVALFACCFILPLLTGDQGMLWNTRRDVLLIGSGFTAAVAVFQFRFLCQRNAAIFMLGLPLKRRKLFLYCWLAGWMMILPVVLINATFSMLCGDSGFFLPPLAVLYQTMIYAITVFFVTRSRRLLDAVLIGFGWMLALFLFQESFLSFFNDRSQFFIMADEYNIVSDQLQLVLSFLNLIRLGEWSFDPYSFSSWYGLILMAAWLLWLLLAAAASFWSVRAFEQLDAETCGSPSRSYAVYPFLLLVVTFSLLNLITLNEWTLFLSMMIFLIYAVLYCLYRRRIRFTLHMISGFAVLVLAETVISLAFVYTEGMGFVQESPQTGFSSMTLYVPMDTQSNADNLEKLDEVNARYGKKLLNDEVISDITITFTPGNDAYEAVRGIQQQLMRDTGSQWDTYYQILQFDFTNQIDMQSTFCYYVETQEDYDRYMGELLDLLLEQQDDIDVKMGFYNTDIDLYTIYEEEVE